MVARNARASFTRQSRRVLQGEVLSVDTRVRYSRDIAGEVDRERQGSDASLAATPGSRPTLTSNTSNWAWGADTLRMSSTADRPALLCGRIRLQYKNLLDDLVDLRLFPSEASLTITLGYSEPFGQEWHGSLEIKLRAVTLGRKQ
jgi:hypothetical protein